MHYTSRVFLVRVKIELGETLYNSLQNDNGIFKPIPIIDRSIEDAAKTLKGGEAFVHSPYVFCRLECAHVKPTDVNDLPLWDSSSTQYSSYFLSSKM